MNDAHKKIQIATICGVPIYTYWSVPVLPIIASIDGFSHGRFSVFLFYLLGITFLIAVHELGHVFASVLLGHKVLGVAFSFNGGLCYHSKPSRLRDSFVICISGILAQLLLFVATLLFISRFGEPTTSFGNALAGSFLVANFLMIVLNLIPSRGKNGIPSDGYRMWQIIKYRLGKAPHPFPYVAPSKEAVIFSEDTALLTKQHLIPEGFKVGVEILNDGVTPMEVVVECLINYLCMKREWAIELMIKIHNNGGALVSLPTNESAEAVARAISEAARQRGYPLTCRAVSISD